MGKQSRMPTLLGLSPPAGLASTAGRCLLAVLVLTLAAARLRATHHDDRHGTPSEKENQRDEYEVKAALIYQIAHLTTWPKETFKSPRTPFIIAVLGKNPFNGHLKALEKKRKLLHGRSLKVKTCKTLREAGDAQVIIVTVKDAARRRALLARLDDKPCLLIGESSGFLGDGGHVRLLRSGRRIRFDLDLDAFKAAGLRAHSKLIKVARRVRISKK